MTNGLRSKRIVDQGSVDSYPDTGSDSEFDSGSEATSGSRYSLMNFPYEEPPEQQRRPTYRI